jgi:hypothetical protein
VRPTNFFTRLTFFTCLSFFYLSNFFTRQKNVLKNFVKGLSKDRDHRKFWKLFSESFPNYLKIVENISCHQNNYFWSIKTCFKKFWSNAKGTTEYLMGSAKGWPCTGIFFKNCLKLAQAFWKLLKKFHFIKTITFDR